MEQMVKIIESSYCLDLENSINTYIKDLDKGWFVRNIQYQVTAEDDGCGGVFSRHSALLFLEKWLEED